MLDRPSSILNRTPASLTAKRVSGRRCPWGLLWLTKYPNIGMDSGWFVTLEDAVRQCMAWQGENPPGYEIQ